MPPYMQHVYMALSVLIQALQIVSIDYLNVNIMNQIRYQLVILNLSFDELIVDMSPQRGNRKMLPLNTLEPLKRLSSIVKHHCLLRE